MARSWPHILIDTSWRIAYNLYMQTPCPRCKGTGKIDLPAHLVAVVNALTGLDFTSVKELTFILKGDEPHLNVTSVNNRVKVLWELEIVERQHAIVEKGGREFRYKLISKNP